MSIPESVSLTEGVVVEGLVKGVPKGDSEEDYGHRKDYQTDIDQDEGCSCLVGLVFHPENKLLEQVQNELPVV